MNAQDYLGLNTSYPTEHEWRDQEIVEQVRMDMHHANADLRGEVTQDDDYGDNFSETFEQRAKVEPALSDSATLQKP